MTSPAIPPSMIDSEIFAHAPIGLMYSEARIIRRCNHAFAAMFDHKVPELMDRSVAQLYPSQDDFDHTGRQWVQELARNGHHADERIMRKQDGTLFWCRVRGHTLTPKSPLARAIWSFADLSSERPVQELSRRERQVAMLLVEGLTAKEIARRLEISPRTVDVHKNRLITRYGVRNSLELVRCLTTAPNFPNHTE